MALYCKNGTERTITPCGHNAEPQELIWWTYSSHKVLYGLDTACYGVEWILFGSEQAPVNLAYKPELHWKVQFVPRSKHTTPGLL